MIIRLADMDAFKNWIDCGHLRNPTELCFSELDVIRMIDKQPTVEAEPVVHGWWIKEELTGCEPYYLCSVCGKLHYRDYNFCNNCGAHMKRKGE